MNSPFARFQLEQLRIEVKNIYNVDLDFGHVAENRVNDDERTVHTEKRLYSEVVKKSIEHHHKKRNNPSPPLLSSPPHRRNHRRSNDKRLKSSDNNESSDDNRVTRPS